MSIHRFVGGVMLVLGLLAGIAAPASAQTDAARPASGASPQIDVVEAVGVLDDPLISYIVTAIDKANAEGSVAVLMRLDTPGSLGGDIDAVVRAIQDSAVPVVVYVGTPGARAFGAGVRVAAAAHVLALAPVTTYGVATPQDLGADGQMSTRDVADLLAQANAGRDERQSFLAQAADGAAVVAVPDGESGTGVIGDAKLPDPIDPSQIRTLDEQALIREGIADIVAPTLQGVLSRLTDLRVQTAAGPVTLDVDPVTANVRFVNPNLLVRILHTAASPTLAYLLLLAGALALFFEIFQPGFGVAGISAILVLGLGVYSLFPLPVNAAWMAVAVVGLLLLAYDLAIAGLSWPTVLGTVLLGVGSFQMWAVQALSPPGWLLVVGTLSAMVFFGFFMTTVLRAQGNQALAGAGQVEGKIGIVRSVLNPDGHVFVGGALWRARAPADRDRVKPGTRVRVVGLNDQLTLDVAVVEEDDIDHMASTT
jgi:membrane-bound serine protease (ClpP class)